MGRIQLAAPTLQDERGYDYSTDMAWQGHLYQTAVRQRINIGTLQSCTPFTRPARPDEHQHDFWRMALRQRLLALLSLQLTPLFYQDDRANDTVVAMRGLQTQLKVTTRMLQSMSYDADLLALGRKRDISVGLNGTSTLSPHTSPIQAQQGDATAKDYQLNCTRSNACCCSCSKSFLIIH